MDGSAGPSLYPLHRCKTIHLVGIRFVFQITCDIRHGFEAAIYFDLKDVQDCLLSWLLLEGFEVL